MWIWFEEKFDERYLSSYEDFGKIVEIFAET